MMHSKEAMLHNDRYESDLKRQYQNKIVNYKGHAWELGTDACETSAMSSKISISMCITSCLVTCASGVYGSMSGQTMLWIPLLVFCVLSVISVVIPFGTDIDPRYSIPVVVPMMWTSTKIAGMMYDEPTISSYEEYEKMKQSREKQ